jgi:glycosyltransferase involved in cell wall biosynthesis
VPQYRQLAADPRVDAVVAFLSMHGTGAEVDPEFQIPVTWDVPLLDGYRWIHPPNRSPRPSIRGFFGLVNPGIWGEVRRGGYDIVVCHGYRTMSFWIAALAAKVTGASLVWTTDATSLETREGFAWKSRLKSAVLPLIFRSGSAVLAPSSRTERFVTSLGVPPGRVFITPYVVDNDFFSARAADVDTASVRRGWGIPDDAVVGAFVGKLVAWKRPADLLLAAAEVPGLFVILAGDGPLRSDLERLAEERGIADRVRFLGFRNQTELPAIYRSADVLVLPSEYEAFGLVVNEAFACGTPAIVSDACGSAGDLIEEATTGWTFPPADVEALTQRLQRFVDDPQSRADMSRQATARIDEWGSEVWLESVVTAFKLITEKSRRRRARSRR